MQLEINESTKIIELGKKEVLTPINETKRESWIINEVLDLMEQRRTFKGNKEEYKTHRLGEGLRKPKKRKQ